MLDLLRAIPVAFVTACITWLGSVWVQRQKKIKAENDQDDRLEIHRDELTFELLQNARAEIGSARTEVESLREEVRMLRSIEQRFYHFEQSLDHLEAILIADTPETRNIAERNARAFLNRMRRLNEAKGTIANEVQIRASEQELKSRVLDINLIGAKDVEPD